MSEPRKKYPDATAPVHEQMSAMETNVKDLLKVVESEIEKLIPQLPSNIPVMFENEAILKYAKRINNWLVEEKHPRDEVISALDKFTKMHTKLHDDLYACQKQVNEVDATYQFVEIDQNYEKKINEKKIMDENNKIPEKPKRASIIECCLPVRKKKSGEDEKNETMEAFKSSKMESLATFEKSLIEFKSSYEDLKTFCNHVSRECEGQKQLEETDDENRNHFRPR